MEPSSSLFAPENRAQLAESFKSFVSRPENQPLLEEQQRKEVRQALKLQQRLGDLQLRAQVLALSAEDQQRLAPLLEVPVLRSLLQSLCGGSSASNSGNGNSSSAGSGGDAVVDASSGGRDGSRSSTSLADWVGNPRVMGLLTQAVVLLKEGRVTEKQLETLLLRQLQDPAGSYHEEFKAKLPNHVTLPSQLLVEALNEHLKERRAGNKAYQRGQHAEAMRCYERALSIVEFVKGTNADDQAEVDTNQASVLLNMAAVHMAQQEWGCAVERCDGALAAQPGNVAVLVRRAKANIGRHEYQAALSDLNAAAALDPWHEELPPLKMRAAMGRKPGPQERKLCTKMLGLQL